MPTTDNALGSGAVGLATPDEVAEYLHTTPASLAQDRYHHRGAPYIKHGRKVLYRWTDVYAYLEANTVNPQGVA
nr:helix-turn-helix domain-containing protein [Gordonia metallireducens]